MEIVGGSGAIGNLKVGFTKDVPVAVVDPIERDLVILIGELQESLSSRGRMFWTLPVKTVRKEHDKTVFDVPFGLTRRDELINDNLCSVGKITKLSLPDVQGVWASLGVAQLVPQDCKF